MRLKKGKLKDFVFDPSFILAFLVFEQEDGEPGIVAAEFNGIARSFGNVYRDFLTTEDNVTTIHKEAIVGQEMYYTEEGNGILMGYTPIEQADPMLVTAYGYYKGDDLPKSEENDFGAGLN